ncbi:MAG: choice-of-anchor A family protein, partial [Phycisphaerae bacterium]|nr:choice-of-anchor A family protein [Phycisphaerae bacterium]
MNSKMFKFISLFLISGFLCQGAFAVEYYLRAGQTTVEMPGGQVITMWGFAQDSSFGALDGTVQIPGPQLTVPADDPNLVIWLDNNLAEPVSIVIPGQNAVVTPVKFTDAQGRQRIRSFTHETDANNTTAVKYEWQNFRPGTFLYHSASHPAVQVQMGLYGCVKKDALTVNLGSAGQYNMVVFEDAYQHESSSEGNVAIGKNAWYQNFGIATALSGDNARLVVGENITNFDSGSIGSNPLDPNTLGNIYVFGSSNLNLVGYDKLITGDSKKFDFTAAKNYLLEASAYWAGLTANGTDVADGGALTLTGTDPNLNIFSVSGADVSSSSYFVINVPAGSTVLANID